MEKYDFAIIGAGGSGLAAAMYAARLGLKTVLFSFSDGFGLSLGGMITTAHSVSNYPGFSEISGFELSKKLLEHTKSYKNVIIKSEKVESIQKQKSVFLIKTKKEDYETKTVLIATGRKYKKLEVPGANKFDFRGIGYCALCDAPLYKDKVVAVVGGSDKAVMEALILSEYAKKIYIIYWGDKIHPESINFDKISKNKKIEILNNTNILEVKGDEKGVSSVVLDKPYKGKKELIIGGVYVAIGNIPSAELAKSLDVKLNKKDEIIINHMTSETNIHGVFAAGDVTDKPFKQLIIGVAEGVIAAYSAYEYITKEDLEGY